ncbi:hypothetical protein FISHEDRAFT_39699 [Fistulina hepatica ATCC 64428]|uniref:RhoGAP-domain-containing protein n=1 Tax=Fistulina hepatica ATCC 64428 TaxID=1128425 RepID=A0A0D7AGX9_9AGAR|nr:hypothetical protein FISHEDRAFT_39699 [Fistulina hepatica ATCC 64428]
MSLAVGAPTQTDSSAIDPKDASFTRQASSSSITSKPSVAPSVVVTSTAPRTSVPPSPSTPRPEEPAWGANFWVTLVDPATQTSFYACPATGEVSWDPPIGNFVLPPSADGEWWELSDESRGGIPYYYQTKTGETVWERPFGFVIPLGILQNTAVGRRLSRTTSDIFPQSSSTDTNSAPQSNPPNRRDGNARKRSSRSLSAKPNGTSSSNVPSTPRRSFLGDQNTHHTHTRLATSGSLPPIPGSPYVTDASRPGTSTSVRKSPSSPRANKPDPENTKTIGKDSRRGMGAQSRQRDSPPDKRTPNSTLGKDTHEIRIMALCCLLCPYYIPAATMAMSPVKNRAAGKPIPVVSTPISVSFAGSGAESTTTLRSGAIPTLPHDLANDIQQFSESDYARQYFSTHHTGIIFRRKVPVAQMMTWQKGLLTAPLLSLNRSLHRNAIKTFKTIQRLMGDREEERPQMWRGQSDASATASVSNGSIHSLTSSGIIEQRWLLGEGLAHGELRDEIYCQVMKQLNGNPRTESVFKGWQLICVLLMTFPPSKNFETNLRAFIQRHTGQKEGRIDVMAKYCLRRLAFICRKGPRGKTPSASEIETVADAAFNPSTFGESLDAIIRLQERNYPHQKVPIILPFLADGILALGGTKSEGIFRVAGDSDLVSELKLRIDRGYYTLDGINDPHVLASLMKLWLRELCDPLVPEEMYNECITSAQDAGACVRIVHRLPTVNRRVALFVISFLQLFLDEKTQSLTKMTPANLALVMAPNLLRCNSDSMSVVFTNARFEQEFVLNLLLHLKCNEVDVDFSPTHGLGAVEPISRPSKSRSRRPAY